MQPTKNLYDAESAKLDRERRLKNRQTVAVESMEDFWPQWKGAVDPINNSLMGCGASYERENQKAHAEINRKAAADMVNHPPHYTSHPSGVECITITQHMGFNLGNALKYIWRADLKKDAIEDMKKAVFYLNKEIEKRAGTNT